MTTGQAELSTDDARDIAADGWIYGYAYLDNYRIMYDQAIDATNSNYVGGFGRFRHYPKPFTPKNTDVVTPNNDTPYSWAWLDLCAEPWVVSVPAIGRYYVLPFHDMDTVYAGFVGSRATGPSAGDYLIAGPDWDRAVPAEISGVIRAATPFVGCLGRTFLADAGDVDALKEIQSQYKLQPLSAYLGQPAPAPTPPPLWPIWRGSAFDTIEFFAYLDILLKQCPVQPGEEEIRTRLASISVGGRDRFEIRGMSPERRSAIEQGIVDGRRQLTDVAGKAYKSSGLFGTREQMAGHYLKRDVGVMKGIYGLPDDEAWYAGWLADSDGNELDGAIGYTVTFPPGQLPPAKFFWSATLYGLPKRLLTANPINRYSIGDRTPGLVYRADGGLTLHIQHERPAAADEPNWLPAPVGPFTVIIRAYGPDPSISDGTWKLPPMVRNS